MTKREYLRHPGAVMMIPLLDDGRVILERQFRYPLRRSFVEFPAGKLEPGESVLACAERELREETGYAPRTGPTSAAFTTRSATATRRSRSTWRVD